MDIQKKFDPFDQMTFSYDKCFLCGDSLNGESYSKEHIYPKWLQNKFDLWDEKLTLLNGTLIPYRSLTIPCCKKCNEIMNIAMEEKIEYAVNAGYNDFILLDEKIIFQWLNKLSYGILFKDLSLKRNRSNPKSESIYTEDALREHRMQFIFLQSILYDTKFIDNPWSILIFKVDPSFKPDYWAYDNIILRTFMMKMNDIGIFAHLMDNGCQKQMFIEVDIMKELLSKELHPIQFFELCAKLLYKSKLFNRNPFYQILWKEDKLDSIISTPISGSIFSEWNQEEYAHCLEFFLKDWGLSFDDIYLGNELVISYLRNEDGSFKNVIKEMNKVVLK